MPVDEILRGEPEGAQPRERAAALRLLTGGAVSLLTSRYHGRVNVMPVAWQAPLSSQPPLLGVAIHESRFTMELITRAEEFALSFPTRALLHHVQYLGSLSGEQLDKLELAGLESFAPRYVTSPLLEGCAAWVECEVVQVLPAGDHQLVLGHPLAVLVDPVSFDQRWRPEAPEERRPLHYLGDAHYGVLGRLLRARVPESGDSPGHALRRQIAEELELDREARERREEERERLREEVAEGRAVDLAAWEAEELPPLDLSLGVVVEGPPGPEAPDR
ncbi:MAG: flavin reductase family protein [Chloroflexi bacterium]|nr:flavin reductase family protein [Chloroflexota bacterium]